MDHNKPFSNFSSTRPVTQLRDIRSKMTDQVKGRANLGVGDTTIKDGISQINAKIEILVDAISAIETSIAMIAHRMGFTTPNRPVSQPAPVASAPAYVGEYQMKKF